MVDKKAVVRVPKLPLNKALQERLGIRGPNGQSATTGPLRVPKAAINKKLKERLESAEG